MKNAIVTITFALFAASSMASATTTDTANHCGVNTCSANTELSLSQPAPVDVGPADGMVRSDGVNDIELGLMKAFENDDDQMRRTKAPANMWVDCLENDEVMLGFSLGKAGAAMCWDAQRNLTTRGVPITERSVIAEMTVMSKGKTRTYSAACLEKLHFPKGELIQVTRAQSEVCIIK